MKAGTYIKNARSINNNKSLVFSTTPGEAGIGQSFPRGRQQVGLTPP